MIQNHFLMPFLMKNNLVLIPIYFLIFLSGNISAQKVQDSLSKYSYTELSYLAFDSEKDSIRLHIYINEYKQRAFREKNNERISAYYKTFVFYQKQEDRFTFIDSALHYAYKTHDKALIGDAYLARGIVYHNIKDYKKTLDNYLKANDYISQTNDAYKKHRIKNLIGVIKNYLGYYEEAENLFRECVAYFGQDETSYNMQRGYVSSLEGLAWSVLKTNHIEESNQILQTALLSVQKAGFSGLDGHYIVFKQGINDYFLNHYDEAIRKIEEKLPFLYENEDFAWATVGNFYIGKAFWNKNDKEKAIAYFKNINEVFENQNYTHPDLRESYELLINYYKSKNDKDNQIRYIEQLVKVDSVYNQSYKHLVGQIHKEYETKDLLQAKRELQASLYIQKHKTAIISVTAILILVISVIVYAVQQKKAKKTAQELIRKIEDMQQSKVISFEFLKTIPKPQQIKDETVQKLLEKLNIFEEKQKFRHPDISLEKLAGYLKTNTTYLSNLIKEYRAKSFADYLNTLRINYIIYELNNDHSGFLKYSLDALAKEAGFKSGAVFSRAFKKYIKVSPSVFIKELTESKFKKFSYT
ncbi:MAG: helix-turn-helix domain-containing protein [Flavobacteriaceae bacterium]|jgi:YesN/AraC family two-component response regulator|nr:helix-turn-helix domain-containing protein [Flavobacteriaceae bacterium]